MKDHEMPEAVAARKNQVDPFVEYLVVRKSLNMSAGKIAAQCAHAANMLNDIYHETDLGDPFIKPPSEELLLKMGVYAAWKNTSYRKVVLVADEKDWLKLKELPDIVIVRDAGLTEVEPGSETVIGIWPMKKSAAPKLVQKLQTLK